MRRVLLLTAAVLIVAAPAFSAGLPVTPRQATGMSIPYDIQPAPNGEFMKVPVTGAGQTFASAISTKAPVTLNCENSNVPAPRNTLVILPPDLAGTIFSAPAAPNPYGLATVRLGLLDFGASFPLTINLQIFEDNLAGSFEEIFVGTVTVDSDWGGLNTTAILEIDCAPLGIILTNDVLLLYSDANASPTGGPGGGAGGAFPVGDNTPRCFDGQNDSVCSVVADFTLGQLFIYGVGASPDCPAAPNGIQLWDVVCELDVDEPAVATEDASWGAVKSLFEK